MKTSLFIVSTLLGLSSLMLSGCQHTPTHADHTVPMNATTYYVKVAPPAQPQITRPQKPNKNAIWIDGYWSWTGTNYTWAKGYWHSKKPVGQEWSPSHWVKTDRGWYRKHGKWVPKTRGNR